MGKQNLLQFYFNSIRKTCHVRHISPSKEHPEKNLKTDKKIAKKLDYGGIEISVQEKDFSKIEKKNNICINMLGYKKMDWFF